MSMTNLKNDDDGCISDWRPSNFGYGTEITLNGEQCEKLGITAAMKVGQPVTIRAAGLVTRSGEELEASNDSGGKDVTVSIQITDLEIKSSGTANAKRAQDILYGSNGE